MIILNSDVNKMKHVLPLLPAQVKMLLEHRHNLLSDPFNDDLAELYSFIVLFLLVANLKFNIN